MSVDDYLNSAEIDTLSVRAGQRRTQEGEHSEALFLTSSFVFDSCAHAAKRFSGEEPGNIYSRFTNPTVRAFEERLAAMEGGQDAVATASGMAAILALCLGLLKNGDHVVVSRSVFGTTTVLFGKYLQKFGVDTTFVSLKNIDEWRAATRATTRLYFAETPSNPLNELVDVARLAELARDKKCLLAIDNCFCTPALQLPLQLGADIVVHSATKFIDGQGRCIGGAVVGSEEWINEVRGVTRTCGPSMSPFNAWVFLKGLETLSLRMEKHSSNSLALARWLEAIPTVEKVHYCGLSSHPDHELAKKQQKNFGGVLSFCVKGGREEAWKLIDATRLFSLTANLGDTKSTIVHPATTTHGRLSDREKLDAGISENLIRISVGLESVDDMIADLDRAFSVLKK